MKRKAKVKKLKARPRPKPDRRKSPRARPPRVKTASDGTVPDPEFAAVASGDCVEYPVCSRGAGDPFLFTCLRPACEHEVPEPHPCRATACAGYQFPEGMSAADFHGGGGTFGGGGATGGW